MSFWIYPICFGASFCLLRLSDRVKENQRFIIVFLALLIPSLLSGCRDHSMGYDVSHYGDRYFELATTLPLNEYIDFMFEKQIEPLYALLNLVVAFFCNSSAVLYGVQTFIILSLVYVTVVDNKYSISVCLLAFYCILFIDTFNVLRQHLSVAVVLFAFRYIKRRKLFKFILTILVSMGFHVTGVIGFLLWPLYWWLNSNLKYSDLRKVSFLYRLKKDALIIALALGFVAIFSPVIEIAVNLGVLPTRYVTYLSDNELLINVISIFTRVPLVMLSLFLYKDNVENDTNNDFLIVCLFLEMIFVQLKSVNLVFLRLSYALLEYKILIVGMIFMNFRELDRKTFIVRLLLYAYLIGYFVLQFFVLSKEGFYSSTILGI